MTKGQRLKEILDIKNISNISFSKSAGCSRQTVDNWINGQLPSGSHIEGIHSAYPDINIMYWFFGEGKPLTSQKESSDYGAKKESKDLNKLREVVADYAIRQKEMRETIELDKRVMIEIIEVLKEVSIFFANQFQDGKFDNEVNQAIKRLEFTIKNHNNWT